MTSWLSQFELQPWVYSSINFYSLQCTFWQQQFSVWVYPGIKPAQLHYIKYRKQYRYIFCLPWFSILKHPMSLTPYLCEILAAHLLTECSCNRRSHQFPSLCSWCFPWGCGHKTCSRRQRKPCLYKLISSLKKQIWRNNNNHKTKIKR